MDEQQDKKIVNRDVLKWVIIGLAGFIIICLVLGVGVWIGAEKAKFSYRWAENYNKNFGGPRAGFMNDLGRFPAGDFIEGHGTFGEIIKINSDLVVKGQGDAEKIIVVSPETVIQKGRDTIKKEELKVGDNIVVIGSPNESGQIEAKLIRVLPGPPPSQLQP